MFFFWSQFFLCRKKKSHIYEPESLFFLIIFISCASVWIYGGRRTEAFYDCNSMQLRRRTGRPGEHESNPLITFSLCGCCCVRIRAVRGQHNQEVCYRLVGWRVVHSLSITADHFVDFGLFAPPQKKQANVNL